MNEFSQLIKIVFLNKSIFFDFSHDKSIEIIASDSVNWSEKPKSNDNGTIYEQAITVTAERAQYPELEGYCGSNLCVATLMDDNQEYRWGSSKSPVKLVITPYLTKFRLEFSASSTTPLLG